MASNNTYGDFPGVRVETAGGAITGVAIGREQKLVIVGVGDPSNGSASVNTATQIKSRLDADRKFGDGSELAEHMKDALANGANIDHLYGVMLDTTSITAETVSGGSGTLTNNPIIEDTSVISVTNTTASSSETPVFRYDSPPTTSDVASDEVAINPITGEVEAGDSDDYEIDYDYPDWTSGLDESETVIGDEETGVIALATEAEDIASDLSSRVNTLRSEYQMALGVSAAQPNANQSEDNDPLYDTSAYSDSIDNDAYYLHAPARKDESKRTVTGAVGGVMAGNDLDDSIYSDNLDIDEDMDQRISKTDAANLRGEEVIPVRQPPSGGSISLRGNASTSTNTDWDRDYWYRRIVDQVILIAKTVGDSAMGQINDETTRDGIRSQIRNELSGLASDRLIEPNTEAETNWFVDVYDADAASTIGIDIGVTPRGLAKRIDVTITVSTA